MVQIQGPSGNGWQSSSRQLRSQVDTGGVSSENFSYCSLLSYQGRDAMHRRQTESITGTSTRTPTTVANAAGLVGPKSVIATATASSKKLLAPIRAPGVATLCLTLNNRISP